MTTALFGSVAPCFCFRLSPVQLLRPPSSNLSSKNHESHPNGSSFQSGFRVFSPWRGLTHVHHSFPSICKQLGKKRKPRCMVAYACLFGVGAPEILVIGVVALLVFGPKGLAEVARNLGKTLRAFQPTIRELQEVSREFRSTLEREIGLDEGTSASNSVYRPSSIFNENQHATFDSNGKPTAKSPLAATESPEEQPRAQRTSEAVTSPPSQEASAPADPEINAQTPSLENAEEGSK